MKSSPTAGLVGANASNSLSLVVASHLDQSNSVGNATETIAVTVDDDVAESDSIAALVAVGREDGAGLVGTGDPDGGTLRGEHVGTSVGLKLLVGGGEEDGLDEVDDRAGAEVHGRSGSSVQEEVVDGRVVVARVEAVGSARRLQEIVRVGRGATEEAAEEVGNERRDRLEDATDVESRGVGEKGLSRLVENRSRSRCGDGEERRDLLDGQSVGLRRKDEEGSRSGGEHVVGEERVDRVDDDTARLNSFGGSLRGVGRDDDEELTSQEESESGAHGVESVGGVKECGRRKGQKERTEKGGNSSRAPN